MAKHTKDVPKKNQSSKGPQKGHITKRQMKQAKYKRSMGNVAEGQGYADKKKHAVVRQYQKMLKKESKAQQAKCTGDVQARPTFNPSAHRNNPVDKKSTFHKADEIRKNKLQEKEKKVQEKEETEKSQQEALKKYKHKKRHNYKKLAKVNYKGQPNLASQMELLLEKIQKRKT